MGGLAPALTRHPFPPCPSPAANADSKLQLSSSATTDGSSSAEQSLMGRLGVGPEGLSAAQVGSKQHTTWFDMFSKDQMASVLQTVACLGSLPCPAGSACGKPKP